MNRLLNIIEYLLCMALNWFNKINLDSEKYKKDKFLNEPFIEHYFAIQFNKPNNYTTKEFEKYLEEVNLDVLGKVMVATIDLAKMQKSVTTKSYKMTELPKEYFRVLSMTDTKKDSYFMLIRFPDITKQEALKGFKEGNLRYSDPSKKRNYLFTPLQSIKFLDISKFIEFQLHALVGLKPAKQMTLINDVDNEVIINEFDCIQYYYYPLSKRAELYSKYPKLEKKMFGMSFPKFAKWIIDKENTSEFMKRNVERTRNILKKYNLPL